MDQKSDYLVWREKNGFFTALDRRSNLITWSLLTGKLLYKEIQERDASMERMEKYEVYRSDGDDITYTRDRYNFRHCSISLLQSKEPLSESLI